jgi:hypothetical protein
MKRPEKVKTRILLFGVMILFCTIIAMRVLAEDQRKDEKKPSVTGWQHLSLTHTISDKLKSELGKSINKLGREGWELVSVENITESGTTTKTVFYFKKPL